MSAAVGVEGRTASRWPQVQPWLSLLARLGLAAVWLLAGGAKVTHTQQAIQAVRAYQILPDSLAAIVGLGLPIFEMLLGLLLLVGLLTRPVAALSALLFVVFITGVASAWARGLSIDCGCFGGGGNIAPDQTTYVAEILRDLGFLVLAAFLIWKPLSRFSLDRYFAPESGAHHYGDEDDDE